MAVKEDSQSTFTYVQSLIDNNLELKGKVAFMSEQLDYERKHLKKTIQDYEKLHEIGKAKQCILWQYIQRLAAGEDGPQTPPSQSATGTEVNYEERTPQNEPNGANLRLDPNAVGCPHCC